jgi:hypothetical protein
VFGFFLFLYLKQLILPVLFILHNTSNLLSQSDTFQLNSIKIKQALVTDSI